MISYVKYDQLQRGEIAGGDFEEIHNFTQSTLAFAFYSMPRTVLQSIKALVKDEKKTRLVLIDGSFLEGTIYLHDQQSNSIILCSAQSKEIISDLRLIPITAIKEVGPPDASLNSKSSQKGSGKSTPKKTGSATPDRRGSRGDVVAAATNDSLEPIVSIPKEVSVAKTLHKKSGSSTPVRRGSRAENQLGANITRESSASSVTSKEPAVSSKDSPAPGTKAGKKNKSGTSTPARRGSRPDPPTSINGAQDNNARPQSATTSKDSTKGSISTPKTNAVVNSTTEQTQSPSLSEDGRLLLAGLSKHLQVRQNNQALIITASSTEIRLDPPYTKIEGTGEVVDKVRRILNSERQVMPKKEKGRRINVKVPVKGG